jgi:hypothetical protein
VFPADDPRLGPQADLLRILQLQRVEISRATQPITVSVPVKNKPAESRTFPAGSYVVRMDQPYSRVADALLDYQYWAPDDPQRQPYDDTAWTFPELFNVKATRVMDAVVLKAPMELVTGDVKAPGAVTGSGEVFVVNHNADPALITLRYRLKDAKIEIAEEPFEAGGTKFTRGSFIVSNVSADAFTKTAQELGVKAVAVSSAPSVKTHPGRAARVALLHTWINTQDEGWWRQTLDLRGVPFTYISTQTAAKETDLRSKYDVILFPPVRRGSTQQIVDGTPMYGKSHPVADVGADAQHRQGRLDRRYPSGPRLPGPDEPAEVRQGWRRPRHRGGHGGVRAPVRPRRRHARRPSRRG